MERIDPINSNSARPNYDESRRSSSERNLGVHELENQNVSSKGLEELWSKIDEYQTILKPRTGAAQQTPFSSGLLEYRTVKSTKHRFLRFKKRAIIKAQMESEKAKHDFTNWDGGRSDTGSLSMEGNGKFHEDSIELTEPSLIKNTSLDCVLTKAFGALDERETGVPKEIVDKEDLPFLNREYGDFKEVDVENLALLKESPMKAEGIAISGDKSMKSEELSLFKQSSKAREDDHTLVSTCLSVEDSLDSWDVNEYSEEGAEKEDAECQRADNVEGKGSTPYQKEECTDSDKSGKNETKDSISDQSPPHCSELKRGTSSMFTKLYNENVELAETLAATQSELEKVNSKLEQMTVEMDEIRAHTHFAI